MTRCLTYFLKRTHIAKLLIPFTIIGILIISYLNPVFHRMSSGIALISGMILSVAFGNPYIQSTKKIASKLLTWSVVGLGFGMNLVTVAKVGCHGV